MPHTAVWNFRFGWRLISGWGWGAPANSPTMFYRRLWEPYGERADGARIGGGLLRPMGAKSPDPESEIRSVGTVARRDDAPPPSGGGPISDRTSGALSTDVRKQP